MTDAQVGQDESRTHGAEAVHRLKADNWSQRRRYAICGAIEEQRHGERLNFSIIADGTTCPDCKPVDTGAVCPARRRWWHRKPREHQAVWSSLDMGNCRSGACMFCGRHVQQRLSYNGRPTGPWLDDVWLPCAHGRGGVPTQACMSCSNERGKRGLYR